MSDSFGDDFDISESSFSDSDFSFDDDATVNEALVLAGGDTKEINDMFFSTLKTYKSEANDRILRNSLLYPISKAFLEDHPQYSDVMRSYESAIEALPQMIERDRDSVLDTWLNINENKTMHLRVNIIRAKLYGPNDKEAWDFGKNMNMHSPRTALVKQSTYFLWLVGDINYSYIIIDKKALKTAEDPMGAVESLVSSLDEGQYTRGVIENGYIVGIPLMLGSKWCATRNFDIGSIVQSGEDWRGYYGCFIIEGYIRYIIPCLKKPINKAITLHNEFDEQLSRVEIQYSRNTQDYQNSYYTVGAMLKPPELKKEGNVTPIAVHELGISLQLNAPGMNLVGKTGKKKELFNFIPIKILFAAFGCTTDRGMIDYVCPDHSDFGLITTVKMASLYGVKHYACYKTAGIKMLATDQGYLKLAEPLTTYLARFIIGMNILKDDVIAEFRKKAKGNENDFREYIKRTVDDILRDRFMPAVGADEDDEVRNSALCVTIGNLFRRLYEVGIDARCQDSKQSLVNKRFFCGQSFVKEFKAFHGHRLDRDLKPAIESEIGSAERSDFRTIIHNVFDKISKQISAEQTRSLVTSFKSSDSQESKFQNEIIEPKNQIFINNKLREVRKNPPTQRRDVRESWENRRAHPSEFGYLCPTETPDSSNVGKFRALSVHTKVTRLTPAEPIIKFIKSYPKFKKTIDGAKIREYYSVSVNGSVIGHVHEWDDAEELYKLLMNERRKNETIPCDVSVSMDNDRGMISVWCDSGRLTTPHIIVANCFNVSKGEVTLKPKFAEWLAKCNKETGCFMEGIHSGFIEFIDSEMASFNIMLAGNTQSFYENPLKFTHISMNQSMDGIVLAANPCASLQVGIRAGMASNHLKQAMGVPLSKYPQLAFIGLMDILIGAQEPIIQPAIYRYLHLDQCPIGQNITICFCQFKYNQDDSVIFNRESVENGFLECDTLTCFKSNTVKNDEIHKVPDKNSVQALNANPFSYEKLGKGSCLPKSISSVFYTGDALIGKIKQVNDKCADVSETNKMPDARNTINPRPMRCVERVKVHEKDLQNKMLITGQFRVVIPGDKVNQEQAQKQTVGKILDPECLPYTNTGKRADVYFNPLSVFKRKTYGCLYLAILMKIAAHYGCFLENSSYGTCRTPEELLEVLKKMDVDDKGFEIMYDPETGEQIKNPMFFGMTYYERQHHLVESKINVRCKGGKDTTYRMPTRGKKVGGGLTVDGKLSLNAINSSGANFMSKDMHLNQCSKIEVGFCQLCGSVACYKLNDREKNYPWVCPCCGKHPRITPRLVSASFPLLNHIFNAMHCEMRYWDEAYE